MATANNEFFEALAALEKERGLPEDYLVEKIKAAIVIAVKKDYEVEDDNVVVDIDPEIGAFRASLLRDIVEEVENPHTQVSLEDAQKVRKSYKVGQRMVTPLKTKEFGRIAARGRNRDGCVCVPWRELSERDACRRGPCGPDRP